MRTSGITGVSPSKYLHENLIQEFIPTWAKANDMPVLSDVLCVQSNVKTRRKFESFVEEGGFGLPTVVREGENIPSDDFDLQYEKSYYPIKFGKAYDWTEDSDEMDLHGIIGKFGPKFAASFMQLENVTAANLFTYAGTTTETAYLGPDGVSVLNSAHPLASGTFSNVPSTNTVLSQAAIAELMGIASKQVGHRGEAMPELGPFTLIHTANDLDAAMQLTRNPNDASTADRRINPWQSQIARAVNLGSYTSATTRYMLLSKRSQSFLIERRPYTLKRGPEIRNDSNLVTVTRVFQTGWRGWRGTYGYVGA